MTTVLVALLSCSLVLSGCRKRRPAAELRVESVQATVAALKGWLGGASKQAVIEQLRAATEQKVEFTLEALACFGEAPGATRGTFVPVSAGVQQAACLSLSVVTMPEPVGMLFTGTGPDLIDVSVLPKTGGTWFCSQFAPRTKVREAGASLVVTTTRSAAVCGLGRPACLTARAALGPLESEYGECGAMGPKVIPACFTWRDRDGAAHGDCTLSCDGLRQQRRNQGAQHVSECTNWYGVPILPARRTFEATSGAPAVQSVPQGDAGAASP